MLGDEGTFRRWMRFELDTLHAGLVSQRRPLVDLLKEAEPGAPARGGLHRFDPAELRRLAERLPSELRFALRLPIQLYADTEVPDAMQVRDHAAAEALGHVGYGTMGAEGGKAWLARALALQAVRDWPTCVQFVYL